MRIWNHKNIKISYYIPLCHLQPKHPWCLMPLGLMGWLQQWCSKGPVAALSMRMSWGISWPTRVQLQGLHGVHHASRQTCHWTKAAVYFSIGGELKSCMNNCLPTIIDILKSLQVPKFLNTGNLRGLIVMIIMASVLHHPWSHLRNLLSLSLFSFFGWVVFLLLVPFQKSKYQDGFVPGTWQC